MMAGSELKADHSTIEQHLRHVMRRWHELPQDCVFEVRMLTADDRAAVKDVSRYPATDRGIEDATAHIASMNSHALNAYTVVNPINATAHLKAGKAASDDDIVASFFHWADADDAQAADNIRSFVGPRPTFFVLTGTQPCTRPHVYWELEEPTHNLVAWNATQKAIAATLKTDATVVNASRIMRVAGTVNWPKPQKQAKGYVQEVTRLTIYDEDDRPLVSLERMARAFVPSAQTTTSGLHIDTGAAPQSMDRERTAIQALSGQNWNEAVLRLVGSYVRKGLSDGEIHALTDPLTLSGYTVADTRDEVQGMIDRTRANPKFEATPEYQPNFDHSPKSFEASGPQWSLQSAKDFTADFVAPEYLIDGVIQRGRLYTLTAPTGSGKTAVMLYISTAMSRGEAVCERETEAGDVIYMAGENPDDVRGRVIATMDALQIDPSDCRLHFIPGTFNIRQDMELIHAAIEKLPNVTMVVVDTLAAYFDGDDSNSNAQMLEFARVLRTITTATSKPAVVVPAHPVKNAAKNNLTPMGGSALLNEVDGNLCLWKRDAAVELHWQGKHRGAEFEPLMFEVKGVESDRVRDSKGRIMPTVMAVPLMEVRALEIATMAVSMEDRLLLNIEQYDAQSIRQRCVEIGMVNKSGKANSTGLTRMLNKLRDEKLVTRLRSNWRLTAKGEEAVQIIKDGGSIVDPDQ